MLLASRPWPATGPCLRRHGSAGASRFDRPLTGNRTRWRHRRMIEGAGLPKARQVRLVDHTAKSWTYSILVSGGQAPRHTTGAHRPITPAVAPIRDGGDDDGRRGPAGWGAGRTQPATT